jgi:hypothetical protein
MVGYILAAAMLRAALLLVLHLGKLFLIALFETGKHLENQALSLTMGLTNFLDILQGYT